MASVRLSSIVVGGHFGSLPLGFLLNVVAFRISGDIKGRAGLSTNDKDEYIVHGTWDNDKQVCRRIELT